MKNIGCIILQLLLLGSLSAQERFVGKLAMQNNPPVIDPVLPGLVLGLETDSKTYILTQNSHWIEENFLMVDGVTYPEGSFVEIIGVVESKTDITGQIFEELEIESVRKLVSNSAPERSDCGLFYNKNNQSVVIDVGEEGQEWTIEMVDVRGCLLLKKSGRGKCELDISPVPNGMIVYQLHMYGHLFCSGKLVKY